VKYNWLSPDAKLGAISPSGPEITPGPKMCADARKPLLVSAAAWVTTIEVIINKLMTFIDCIGEPRKTR
jgi:hypothetical protein